MALNAGEDWHALVVGDLKSEYVFFLDHWHSTTLTLSVSCITFFWRSYVQFPRLNAGIIDE